MIVTKKLPHKINVREFMSKSYSVWKRRRLENEGFVAVFVGKHFGNTSDFFDFYTGIVIQVLDRFFADVCGTGFLHIGVMLLTYHVGK